MKSLPQLLSFEKEILRQEEIKGVSLFFSELQDIHRYTVNIYRAYIQRLRKMNKNRNRKV